MPSSFALLAHLWALNRSQSDWCLLKGDTQRCRWDLEASQRLAPLDRSRWGPLSFALTLPFFCSTWIPTFPPSDSIFLHILVECCLSSMKVICQLVDYKAMWLVVINKGEWSWRVLLRGRSLKSGTCFTRLQGEATVLAWAPPWGGHGAELQSTLSNFVAWMVRKKSCCVKPLCFVSRLWQQHDLACPDGLQGSKYLTMGNDTHID